MRFTIFGLSVSSSWGNGHAALWRGLIAGLIADGHQVTFFERDVPYYAANRDLHALPAGGALVLYPDWDAVRPAAARAVAECDVAMITSYCPDALAATALVQDSRAPMRCFYDLDTPVTLARLADGQTVDYLGPAGLRGFDLVLSYTGGAALTALQDRLGARRVAAVYGSVDPACHHPVPASSAADRRYALSYLGTYAQDRQVALEALLIEPARRRPAAHFVIGGAQYPQGFSLDRKPRFQTASAAGRSSRLLRRIPSDAERDACSDGGNGLVPVRPIVRGGVMRRADPERCMGWAGRVLHAG